MALAVPLTLTARLGTNGRVGIAGAWTLGSRARYLFDYQDGGRRGSSPRSQLHGPSTTQFERSLIYEQSKK